MKTSIEDQLGELEGAGSVERRHDELWVIAPDLDVESMAKLMKRHGARLSTMSAVALEDAETEIVYHYAIDHQSVNVKARTRQGAIPSIVPITKAAGWIEREIHDLYSVEFTGHPNLRRLIRPPNLPQGFFREPGGEAGKRSREKRRE